jgi:hypothetical protein
LHDLSIVVSPTGLSTETKDSDLIIYTDPIALLLSTSEPPCEIDLTVNSQELVLQAPVVELGIETEHVVLDIGQLVPVGGGEENAGANVGGGAELYQSKTGLLLNFRSLVAAGDIAITQAADTVTISTASTGDVFLANCLATDQPGDCVYITGPVIGGLRQVTKIDPLSAPVQIFVGVLLAKSSATECTIQRTGEYAVPYSVGLAGIFFVGVNGRFTPTPIVSGALQAVATGVNTDVVLLQPGWQIHKLRG